MQLQLKMPRNAKILESQLLKQAKTLGIREFPKILLSISKEVILKNTEKSEVKRKGHLMKKVKK